MLLAVSVIVNLGLLGYFKYGEFLLENFIALAAMVGVACQPPEWNIILPATRCRPHRWPDAPVAAVCKAARGYAKAALLGTSQVIRPPR